MKEALLIGMPGGYEWLIILVVILLLFGGSRLPQLAKALGQSKRAFREGQDEADEEARRDAARKTAEIAAPPSQLSSVNDEELFEEARRRAATLRANDPKS